MCNVMSICQEDYQGPGSWLLQVIQRVDENNIHICYTDPSTAFLFSYYVCFFLLYIQLLLPGPLAGWFNMNCDTSMFSPPLSHLILEGSPYCMVALRNYFRTVMALLLDATLRYTGSLE